MTRSTLEHPIFANINVTIADGSSAEAKATVTGSLTLDWEKYVRGKSLLECCILSKSEDPYECNFPSLNNICLPTQEEYAAFEAEQAAANGGGI
jgi:hypothetical protein